MATRSDVSKALALSCEFYGRTLSEAAADMLMADLAEYPPDDVLEAIRRCRKELARFPTPADIIARVQAKDGRPGKEEAWSMIPHDEMSSCVWTVEMATAYGAARPLIKSGDLYAARAAFNEVYEKEVKRSREVNMPATWSACLGMDRSGRDAALEEAYRRNQVTLDQGKKVSAIPDSRPKVYIAPPEPESVPPEEAKSRIRELIDRIGKRATNE